LHLLFCLPWLQIDDPPHSLHILFCLPWLQNDDPPQSLHLLFCLPWLQIDDRLQIDNFSHSSHSSFCLPWLQSDDHTTTVLPILFDLCLPCVRPSPSISVGICGLILLLLRLAARADLAISSSVSSRAILLFCDEVLIFPLKPLWSLSATGIAEKLTSDSSINIGK
jgi:hypothetical protein